MTTVSTNVVRWRYRLTPFSYAVLLNIAAWVALICLARFIWSAS